MASWGDVNAALNRLVREGVITGFKTNLASPDRSSGLHVVAKAAVVVDESAAGYDSAKVEAVRDRVAGELGALVDSPTVVVENSAAA